MTRFRDTTDHSSDSRFVPVDLITIDGKDIYDILPGYRQLNTEGRHLVPLSLNTRSTPGQDGDDVEDSRLASIDLTITYQMDAESPTALRSAMATLNSVLIKSRREKNVTFADDDGYSYPRCYLSDTSILHEVNNTVVGTFTFKSLDAYAQKQRQSDGTIALTYAEKVRPKRISVTFDTNVEAFGIYNGNGQQIAFSKTHVAAGSPVVIEYSRERIRAYNKDNGIEHSLLYALTQYNAPYAFYLYDGDTVTVSPSSAALTVEWSDPKL